MKTEDYIKHEVQLRVLDWQNTDLYRKIESLDKKIDTKFNWFYGIIITVVLLPKVLHIIGWI